MSSNPLIDGSSSSKGSVLGGAEVSSNQCAVRASASSLTVYLRTVNVYDRTGCDGVLGAIDLQLVAIHLNVIHYVGNNSVVIGHGVNAKYVVLVLVQNLNLLILQSGVVLGNLSESIQLLASALSHVDGYVQRVSVLIGILGYIVQNTNGLVQTHVLLANGLVLAAIVVVLGVSVITPCNSYSINSIVDQLCSVLTRASCGEGSVYVLQQAVLVSQSVGLGSPVDTYQASLLSVVTEGYEQHLSSFLSGNVSVRLELGCRNACNDTKRLAVLNVAASPVALDVGESGLVIVVRRSVRVTSAQHIDHLRHLRTSYGVVGLERTIGITVDYAQLHQSVHDFGLNLEVSRIRERRTGEHGECASKRQYQCKNLFEITTKIAKTGFECRNSPKHLIFPHFFEKLRPVQNWQFVALRLPFLPRTRKFSFGIINKVSR